MNPVLLAIALVIASILISSPAEAAASSRLVWSELEPLPDAEGFAGMLAGVSGSTLIVAGGANIVGNRWEDPLHKVWYDTIFALDRPKGHWVARGHLPHACAYGVSITTEDGVVCVGGNNSTGHLSSAFRISLENGIVRITKLPALPLPIAYACGGLVGHTIYLAGGCASPDSPALKHCWTMDLNAKTPAWTEIAPWPGAAREKAVAGAADGSFFLFGGVCTERGEGKKLSTRFLKDAYCYTPGSGWKRLADLPFPAAAAPSPAIPSGSELLIVGGDDGADFDFQPVRNHPEFARRIQAYSIHGNRWSVVGNAPFSRVTTPTVAWESRTIIPNGEVRPRVRNPAVWMLGQEK